MTLLLMTWFLRDRATSKIARARNRASPAHCEFDLLQHCLSIVLQRKIRGWSGFKHMQFVPRIARRLQAWHCAVHAVR